MRPKHAIDYQNIDRPLAVMRREYKTTTNFGWHSHRRGQFLVGNSGYMTAMTEEGAFMLPGGYAILIALTCRMRFKPSENAECILSIWRKASCGASGADKDCESFSAA